MCRILLLLLAAGWLVLPACAPAEPVASTAPERPRGPLPDESIYHADSEWESHRGESMRLAELRGGPVLVAMTFTNCASACPLIVRDMQAMSAEMSEATRADLRYVLVSLDPERDTRDAMRGFADAHGLGDEWTLLRGTPEDVQTLAALLDVRYRPEADGQIAHSNAIHLLDADGRLAARQEGLGEDPAAAIAALEDALSPGI